jgi:hypothetical protein
MSEQSTITSFNPEQNARCRALIIQAANAKPGMTYMEIRDWILEHYRFQMENVGGRVREARVIVNRRCCGLNMTLSIGFTCIR